MIELPAPNPATLARRAEIAAALRSIVPDGVIGDEATLTAFDCDALTAYRQRPFVCVLPANADQVAAVVSAGAGSGAPPHSGHTKETYCPAPYDQFVIQWNGDVTTCCTDYEGRTKTANVFADGIEGVWKSETLKQRKKDMLEGRLLDVCAKCQGVK